MQFLKSLYKTIIDSVFPLSPVEQQLFAITPEEALRTLSPAPDYSGLATPLHGARSLFAYKDERVAKLIWNIKYKKSDKAVKIGGYALFQTLINQNRMFHDIEYNILVIPIPITSKRRRERGYNQCELLSDEIERLALNKYGSSSYLIFEKNLLMRTQNTSRQTLKGRHDRIESAKQIFSVNKNISQKLLTNKTAGLRVIIIDDVITTGSTMHEAIKTLEDAGFANISALSLAH